MADKVPETTLASDPQTELWEVLVPTVRNNGTPYRTRFHRVWDTQVRVITGGLTIMPVARGQWVSPEGDLFAERMIPVRIAATRAQIEQVIDLTIAYYEQQAVMAYRISDVVIIRRAAERSAAPRAERLRPLMEIANGVRLQ